ncbi:MAG: amino acid--tRNA ligase-related protein, partial [Deltaproteobacteria bacterium]
MEITGRVLACPRPDELIVADGVINRRVCVPSTDVQPGDLVRIAGASGDPGVPALTVERVFRPQTPPFGPGTETTALLSSGRLARLTRRAEIVASVRAHFASQQSLEVETPAMAVSPGLDLHLHAFEVTTPIVTSRNPDESGRRTSVTPFAPPYGYLITSPEYHMKRLLAGGVKRCHQFARCFRASESGAR